MQTPSFDQLLEATCHFGHLKRKWNPAMAPYIFMERNGIHIIDLYKTQAKLEEAAAALKNIAKSGKKVLFVATKKQAKQVVADRASAVHSTTFQSAKDFKLLANVLNLKRTSVLSQTWTAFHQQYS